jgi:hypothetical protein
MGFLVNLWMIKRVKVKKGATIAKEAKRATIEKEDPHIECYTG